MPDGDHERSVEIPDKGDCTCGCSSEEAPNPLNPRFQDFPMKLKLLTVDLFAIDLTSCKRCVPTGDTLAKAVRLLQPVAAAMGIELREYRVVIRTPEEAKALALITSPSIRLNGRDIVQDVRESECESCGDLVEGDSRVACREWHYKGQVFTSAPLPMLIEAIMQAMVKIDNEPPVTPTPLEELPDNLERYFSKKKSAPGARCCE